MRHGRKIEGLSLSCMSGRILSILLLVGGTLSAAPESLAVQEMRLSLETISQRLHSHTVELNLFHERLQNLEKLSSTLKSDLKASASEKTLEKRIAALEKGQSLIASDFQTLKSHLTETNAALATCQTQLGKIDKQITSDIQSLKTALNSMLALLQPTAAEHSYTVQNGDSLGQIAKDHKTTIKILKEINNLSSDIIYSGQKLLLP